jgi:hypothetical protein
MTEENYNPKNSEDKINQILKNGIDDFQKECFDIFQKNMDEKFKQISSEIYQNIENKIRNNISNAIGSDNLFDYSEFPKGETVIDYIMKLKIIYHQLPHHVGGYISVEYMKNIRDNFIEKIKNKHIVINYQYNCEWIIERDDQIFSMIMVTENSNILVYQRSIFIAFDLDFKIPKDYINLITLLFNSNELIQSPGFNSQGNCHSIYGCKPENDYYKICISSIINVLRMIKDKQYNRKHISIYSKGIIEENELLKSQYNQFEIDKKEFEKNKTEFEQNVALYTDLDKERKDLEEYKKKLKLYAIKLNLEKEQLDEEKRKFNTINLDDLDNL